MNRHAIADWPEVRFRYLAEVQKGSLPTTEIEPHPDYELSPYLTMEYLRGESSAPSLVPTGPSVLLASDDSILLLWDGSNAGEFLRAKQGVVSSTSALVTPKGVDRNFLFWACKGQENRIRAETIGMGIPHVDGNSLANKRIRLPPPSQQVAIADYLDRETARLDALVAAKERVLELLAEKRQALIARAVIRGIDPDVSYRDSGVAWLGDIPAHWEIERARWLFNERDERSSSGDEELLTVSHLTGVTPRSEKQVYMFEAETTEGYKKCLESDLVINTLWAWMGAMGVAPLNGIVSPSYHVYELATQRLYSGYVDALVRLPAFAQEVTRYSKGVWSSRLRLYPEGFFEVSLPVPPREEQREILLLLLEEQRRLEGLKFAAEQAIALLRERRTALIEAAVTGRIDVERAA